jgi:hypothetical protein
MAPHEKIPRPHKFNMPIFANFDESAYFSVLKGT